MKTILLAEDDDDLRELVAHLLERAGYEVRQACNGQEALSALEGPLPMPGLVLLDLMMPVMSGAEFLHVLATSSKPLRPPVVVLSAVADQQRPPGAVAYLRKPVSEDELLTVVNRYVA
jgi:CheY-like chemotaxis protein